MIFCYHKHKQDFSHIIYGRHFHVIKFLLSVIKETFSLLFVDIQQLNYYLRRTKTVNS